MEVRDYDYTTRVPEIHRRHGTDTVRFQQVRSSQGDRTNLWWNTRPKCDLEVPDAAADPAGDATAGTIVLRGGKNADYYEISMKQFQQQILPAGSARHDGLGLRRGRRAAANEGCCSTTPRR